MASAAPRPEPLSASRPAARWVGPSAVAVHHARRSMPKPARRKSGCDVAHCPCVGFAQLQVDVGYKASARLEHAFNLARKAAQFWQMIEHVGVDAVHAGVCKLQAARIARQDETRPCRRFEVDTHGSAARSARTSPPARAPMQSTPGHGLTLASANRCTSPFSTCLSVARTMQRCRDFAACQSTKRSSAAARKADDVKPASSASSLSLARPPPPLMSNMVLSI